jgi:ABC-type branched-subunit amino acid transport system permease subunit
MENWNEFSFGPSGIANIPRPGFFGIEMNIEQATIYIYFLMIAMTLFTIFVVNRLQNSRIGRAWIALREDEVACQAMGIDKRKTKLMAFALGATWAGFAGVVFAAKTTLSTRPALPLGIHQYSVCGGTGRHGIDRGRYRRRFHFDSASRIPAVSL